MPGNVLSVSTPQGAQLCPGAPFKISRLDVVRNRGLGDALTLRWTTAAIVSPVARVIPPGAVVETTWPATIAVATPATALTVSTPFVAPVVTVPSIAASRVLPAVRPLGVHPRAGGIVVLSRPITATRATVLPCKTATCPEAVTLIVAATPACLAVVRAVLTVLIRHGPSFTLALPPVALVLSFTWEEPTWAEVLRRNGTRRHVVWCVSERRASEGRAVALWRFEAKMSAPAENGSAPVGAPLWSPRGLNLIQVCARWCPTLPHPGGCSTIGAVRLSFRVRDGSGRVPVAVTTETSGWAVRCVDSLVWWSPPAPHTHTLTLTRVRVCACVWLVVGWVWTV